MLFSVGDRLGHYEVRAPIGKGGMGEVYAAHDSRLGRVVALKVLSTDREVTQERRQRFLREARMLASLNHPNLVGLHDVGEHQGHDYLVMEYVSGRTLAEVLAAGSIGVHTALQYAVSMADAIARAHAAGILHRDLKPSNVIVTAEGSVKVLDFGLAKLFDEPTVPDDTNLPTVSALLSFEGTVVGTPAYMSPEQAQGLPLDPRSDVFSFGTLLYEMVSGVRPFRGDSTDAVLAAVLTQEPKPPTAFARDLPPALERVILRCLKKDPANRWESFADLRDALRDLAGTVSSGRHRPRFSLTRRWYAPAAAGLLFAAASWLAYHAGRRPTAPDAPPRLRAVQLTAFSGAERHPTLSPDGSQVAFSAAINDPNNYDIYVQVIGSDAPPLRLTTDPGRDEFPSWSPDGRWIAFSRDASSSTPRLLTISPLGGPETLVTAAPCAPSSWALDSTWFFCSPFGSAFSGIQVVTRASGATVPVTGPPEGYVDRAAKLSPDGSRVAFARMLGTDRIDCYVVQVDKQGKPTESPRKFATQIGVTWLWSWSADGKSLITSLETNDSNGVPRLFRIPVDEPTAMPIPLEIGENGTFPTTSAVARRLVYQQETHDWDIWVTTPPTYERLRGSSTRDDSAMDVSTHGSIVFESNRSGAIELWVANGLEDAHPHQLTQVGPADIPMRPKYSPDGEWVVFSLLAADGRSDIARIRATGGAVERITQGNGGFSPTFSADGQRVYFTKLISRDGALFSVPFAGGTIEKVVDRAMEGVETVDGRSLIFARHHSGVETLERLYRLDLRSKLVTELPITTSVQQFAVVAGGIYFVSWAGGNPTDAALDFYSFQTQRVRTVQRLLAMSVYDTIAVSRAGGKVFFSHNADASDLMLVEGFR
jgi:serine/threonine protein kinase